MSLLFHSYLDINIFTLNWMQLDDTILKTIETAPDQELSEARDLILRIRRRDLYQVLKLIAMLVLTSRDLFWLLNYGSL